jgi:hypothetical protein
MHSNNPLAARGGVVWCGVRRCGAFAAFAAPFLTRQRLCVSGPQRSLIDLHTPHLQQAALGRAQGHLHRLFASQERDQMKDPRKRWGLSDTCHRAPV